MVKIYDNSLSIAHARIKSGKNNNNKYNHLNIWKTYPSFKDINKRKSILKIIFLLVIGFGYF
jgi:hypothetical protein